MKTFRQAINISVKAMAFVVVLFIANGAWAILAIDDNYIIPQDSPGFTITPFANDIIQLVTATPPTAADFVLQTGQGSINVSPGNIQVIPAPGFVGALEFGYRVTDITGTDTARIIIDVQANAVIHQAVDDFHHVLRNDFPISFDILANDNFNAANGVQITAVTSSAQGANVAIDPGGLSVSYQPPTDYSGLDTFTYTMVDQANGATSGAQVTVLVGINPGQNAPILSATPEEQETINILDQICSDNPNSALPCGFIATLTDVQKRLLAQQVSGRHAKAQSRAIRQIKNRQGSNVRSRLSELRSGQNRLSVNNLNTVMYDKDVPLALALQSKLTETFSGGSAGENESNVASPWGFFINGNLSFGEGRGKNDRPQYDQDGFNITSGADYRLQNNLILGAALGYGQSNFDFSLNRGTQNSDSFSFSLFGNYYPTASIYIDGIMMFVQSDLDIDRRINILTLTQNLSSNTSSSQTIFASSMGWDFSKNAWQGNLYARVEYSDLTIDAYTESNGGAFQLDVGEQTANSLDYAFGGRLAYAFSMRNGVFMPALEIESVKQGDDEITIESRFSQVTVAQGLRINAADQDTQYLNVALSLSAMFSNGRSGFFRYESVQSHDEYQADSYTLGFRVEF